MHAIGSYLATGALCALFLPWFFFVRNAWSVTIFVVGLVVCLVGLLLMRPDIHDAPKSRR